MPELKIHQNGIVKVLFFEGAPLLAPLLREHGYAISTPCGSAGVCGRCGVRAAGSLEPAAVNGRVLACKTRLAGSAGARRQDQPGIAATAGILDRLQRRRGRTQHQRHIESGCRTQPMVGA